MEIVPSVDPTDTVRCDQAVGNVTVVAFGTESRIGDVHRAAVEADLRKDRTVGIANSEDSWPIRAVNTVRLALIVETIESDGEAIQPIGGRRVIPAESQVVCEIDIVKIAVQRTRQIVRTIGIALVAGTVGEEEFVLGSPVLIGPEAHGGVAALLAGEKDKVILQTRRGGEDRQVGENLLGDGVPHGWGDDIPREGFTPILDSWETGRRRCRGVKNLSRQNLRVVTGIDGSRRLRSHQQGGEVTVLQLILRGKGVRGRRSRIVPVLLPGKEEKGLVPAVVQLGDPHWTTQAAAKIVLVIRRLGRLKGREVVVPRIGV